MSHGQYLYPTEDMTWDSGELPCSIGELLCTRCCSPDYNE